MLTLNYEFEHINRQLTINNVDLITPRIPRLEVVYQKRSNTLPQYHMTICVILQDS